MGYPQIIFKKLDSIKQIMSLNCNPSKPIGCSPGLMNNINRTKGTPILESTNTIGSNKKPSCSLEDIKDDACLAQCPADIANDVCGQHACRKYYYNQSFDCNDNPREDTYCGWLSKTKCQGYCWPMDEFICKNSNCGYGGDGQPFDCKNIQQGLAGLPGTSCGYAGISAACTSISPPSICPEENKCTQSNGSPGCYLINGPIAKGNRAWNQSFEDTLTKSDPHPEQVSNRKYYGCTDKRVLREPTNPNVLIGNINTPGILIVQFNKLPWLM